MVAIEVLAFMPTSMAHTCSGTSAHPNSGTPPQQTPAGNLLTAKQHRPVGGSTLELPAAAQGLQLAPGAASTCAKCQGYTL